MHTPPRLIEHMTHPGAICVFEGITPGRVLIVPKWSEESVAKPKFNKKQACRQLIGKLWEKAGRPRKTTQHSTKKTVAIAREVKVYRKISARKLKELLSKLMPDGVSGVSLSVKQGFLRGNTEVWLNRAGKEA
jgi:pantothenate kinase